MFEHEDDDEYDGEMGLDDDEDPRIRVTFATEEVQTKKATAVKPPTEVKTNTFMEPRGSQPQV